MKVCSVDGCEREMMARTWCKAHYARWMRTGSVKAEMPIGPEIQLATQRYSGHSTDYYWRIFMANVGTFTHPLAAHIKTHEHFHRDRRRDQRDHEAGWRFVDGEWVLA